MNYSNYINLLNAWSGGYTNRITGTFTQGTVAGRFIKFTLIGQLTGIPRGSEINLRTVQLTFDGVPSATNVVDDEYTIDLF